MQYTTFLLAALATLVTAQNPFSFTSLSTVNAGTPFNITWSPSTGTTDTVTLLLRQGDVQHLANIATIASSIQNTGSFLWTPSTSLVAGTGYAFEIVDDGNTAIVNYSNEFTLNSPNTVSSSLPSSTVSSAPSSTGAASSSITALITTGSSTSAASSSTGSSSGGSSSTTAEATTTTSSSAASSSSATKTGSVNAAAEVRVGAALLAVVGAVMAAL